MQSYPCLFWENGYTQCPCWRNILDLIVSRVPDLRLAIVNKISSVHNVFNRLFNTQRRMRDKLSSWLRKTNYHSYRKKNFPIFERYCKSEVIISSNEIPKNFIWMLGLVLYFLAIKPLTTTPSIKQKVFFLKKKQWINSVLIFISHKYLLCFKKSN